ncbi:MAG: iron-containing alcohol dehydrogenase [Clostridia bacterium]|nr:iron-containing alcohol dehydrogenase [Clostridia bacterium]
MENFVYNTPTTVHFGKGAHLKVGELVKNLGHTKIMMQYGKDSIKKSGLYDQVINSLTNNGITVIEKGGVEPNPKVDFVREAVKLATENQVTLILAVGGGSVLDSCKYTALSTKSGIDVWDIAMGKAVPNESLPVACILTHSAAGSEMSNSAVVTNTELNLKKGFSTELNRPKFAIMNPELTYTLSPYQTACGVVDIMAHTMERYFTNFPDCEPTDSIAESILKSVINSAYVVKENPTDYDARATIMWASSLSHNGLTGAGRLNYLAVHQLEHALSGVYDCVSHGAGLAVLFPAWAKYVYKKNVKRFARFSRNVWGVTEENDEICALKGIEKMEQFFKDIKMPVRLSELGINEDISELMAKETTYNQTRTIKSYIELGYKEIKEIFDLCK